MKNLEGVAEELLEEGVLPELCEWYLKTLDAKWEYVVFIVRRSYLLALIMEEITGKKMEKSSNAIFLTDASLILHCSELARRFRENNEFPSILLCDDLLLHGRNINHLIDVLEKTLCELLPEYDENVIIESLASTVQVHVYTKAEGGTLLYGRYEGQMEYIRKGKAKFLHRLSSDISELILHSNISNASYIYSQYVSYDCMERIREETLVSTQYQNTEQYTYVRYVGKGNTKKAILTLRFVKVKSKEEHSGYRAIPFVFLPNLDEDTTKVVLKQVEEKMQSDDFSGLMNMLYEIPGKRTFNELLTMVLSNVLLWEFKCKYKIEEKSKENEIEILKLARNYNFHTLKQAQNCLNEVLFKKLFSINELELMLDEVIPNSFCVLDLNSDDCGIASNFKENTAKIVGKLEDYFYDKGWKEEKLAYELTQMSYYLGPKKSQRNVRGCCFALKEINQTYGYEEARKSIAYFLQMMDVGVLSLSSYAPQNMEVVGFAQFAKAGEQSLLIEPLRYFLYVPLLAEMQTECEIWNLDLKREMEEYCRVANIEQSSQMIDIWLGFVQRLEMIGEKVQDWLDEKYLSRLEFTNIMQKEIFLKKQKEYKNNYREYIKNY